MSFLLVHQHAGPPLHHLQELYLETIDVKFHTVVSYLSRDRELDDFVRIYAGQCFWAAQAV